MDGRPIGILDSGVGGLTIWRQIVKVLPEESTVYIGDSINCPYGEKDPEEILRLSEKLIAFLLSKQAKLIVIACNTITVTCIDQLRKRFPSVPLVGTVPVIKTAVAVSQKRRIGVLVTGATEKSSYLKTLINQHKQDCIVSTIGTNALVPLIEKGDIAHSYVKQVVAEELKAFIMDDVDVIVLGSTHFPFLKQVIRSIMGPRVAILDSAEAIARQVARVLENNAARMSHKHDVSHHLYTTASDSSFPLLSFLQKEEIRGNITTESINL